jgi:uncharacterized protein with von Willebrand factor type A (vWA) domain
MNIEHLELAGLVVLILAAVLVFFLYSQRRLKANVQRIREEYGQPGERDLTIAQAAEASRWDSPPAESAADQSAAVDGKILELREALREADRQIARLQAAIEQARQLGR